MPVTESLNILLRGLKSEMAQITAEDLRITVDLSGITEPGVHTVPVTVQVANYANVGVKARIRSWWTWSVCRNRDFSPSERTEQNDTSGNC